MRQNTSFHRNTIAQNFLDKNIKKIAEELNLLRKKVKDCF